MNQPITMTMDTSGLTKVIPELVSFGRRTVAHQCVTSMGMILQDAQNLTPFVATTRMDADLEVDVEGITATGRPSKAKNPKHFKVTPGQWRTHATPLGVLIVMARMRPGSKYNRLTGSRWALPSAILPTGKGSARDRQTIIGNLLSRMTLARHSSGHYLQSGYKFVRDLCVSSPLFKNRYRARTGSANANSMNKLDASALGRLTMTPPDGDRFSITAENNVGQSGNAVLDAKHRLALIQHSGPALQTAINNETAASERELARRIEEGMPRFNKMLS